MHKDALQMIFQCERDWEEMTPCARGRFCEQCDKVVVDVSSMTREEFARLNQTRKGHNPCLMMQYDEEGQVVFAEPVAPQHGGGLVDWLVEGPSRLKTLSMAGAAVLSMAACASVAAQSKAAVEPPTSETPVDTSRPKTEKAQEAEILGPWPLEGPQERPKKKTRKKRKKPKRLIGLFPGF